MASPHFRVQDRVKLVMQVLITVVVLACALYVVLSCGYLESHHKWAFGIIGVLVGYWLR